MIREIIETVVDLVGIAFFFVVFMLCAGLAIGVLQL